MSEQPCCYTECREIAKWEIYDGKPYHETCSCNNHLVDMIEDGCSVFEIKTTPGKKEEAA